MEIVARGDQVRCVADSKYLVHSQHEDRWYKVECRNDRWLCDCPDYVKREQPCKHTFAIFFLLKLPEVLSVNFGSLHNPVISVVSSSLNPFTGEGSKQ
jgi:hypothetical protein